MNQTNWISNGLKCNQGQTLLILFALTGLNARYAAEFVQEKLKINLLLHDPLLHDESNTMHCPKYTSL